MQCACNSGSPSKTKSKAKSKTKSKRWTNVGAWNPEPRHLSASYRVLQDRFHTRTHTHDAPLIISPFFFFRNSLDSVAALCCARPGEKATPGSQTFTSTESGSVSHSGTVVGISPGASEAEAQEAVLGVVGVHWHWRWGGRSRRSGRWSLESWKQARSRS